MTPEELVGHYPVLFHMAERGSWPAIRRLGLRTTAQLVAACRPDAATRSALLDRPRRTSTTLTHPDVGPVVVRDQKPLLERNLRLVDTDLAGFLALLNGHVFLWPGATRLDRLLGARSYRDREHDVLVLDTASLLAAAGERVRLTGLNTGASLFPSAPPRGPATFRRVADFPFAERRRTRGLRDAVVEVCVAGGLDDVERHVLRVERRHGTRVVPPPAP